MNLRKRTAWIINFVVKYRNSSNRSIAQKVGGTEERVSSYKNQRTDPKVDFINKFCDEFEIDRLWFFSGEGEPFPGARNEYPEVCGEPILEDYPEIKRKKNRQRSGPGISNNFDSFGEASTGLREIFDSHDPILIPALQANIRAFQIAARREKEILELKGRVKKLEEKCDKFDEIKERLETLERNLPTAAGAGGL